MRKTNENLILLNTLFTTALVVSNVVTTKLFHTGITMIGIYGHRMPETFRIS